MSSTIVSGTEADARLDEAGILHPRAATCPHCDFGSGMRGMDSCGKCSGTGSVFRVLGILYANTERGYISACQALLAQAVQDDMIDAYQGGPDATFPSTEPAQPPPTEENET